MKIECWRLKPIAIPLCNRVSRANRGIIGANHQAYDNRRFPSGADCMKKLNYHNKKDHSFFLSFPVPQIFCSGVITSSDGFYFCSHTQMSLSFFIRHAIHRLINQYLIVTNNRIGNVSHASVSNPEWKPERQLAINCHIKARLPLLYQSTSMNLAYVRIWNLPDCVNARTPLNALYFSFVMFTDSILRPEIDV